jgi:hypothetical protein
MTRSKGPESELLKTAPLEAAVAPALVRRAPFIAIATAIVRTVVRALVVGFAALLGLLITPCRRQKRLRGQLW